MTRLDALVEQVVEGFRTVFKITACVAVALTIFEGNWIGLLMLGPLLIVTYFGGLWLLGQVLSFMVPKEFLREEFQAKRIQIINEKLESGELTVDDPNLAVEMEKAGLRPLSVITEKGPIFGRQFDANLHEWIDAKEGKYGEGRYVYKGKAMFEADGTVSIPDQNMKSLYLVLDGILYERVLEEAA